MFANGVFNDCLKISAKCRDQLNRDGIWNIILLVDLCETYARDQTCINIIEKIIINDYDYKWLASLFIIRRKSYIWDVH